MYYDLKKREVNNSLIILVLVFGIGENLFLNTGFNYLASVIAFMFGFVLFSLKALGGADIKLIVIIILIINKALMIEYLLLTSVFGAMLAVIYLIKRKNSIPYTLAIMGAFLFEKLI